MHSKKLFHSLNGSWLPSLPPASAGPPGSSPAPLGTWMPGKGPPVAPHSPGGKCLHDCAVVPWSPFAQLKHNENREFSKYIFHINNSITLLNVG